MALQFGPNEETQASHRAPVGIEAWHRMSLQFGPAEEAAARPLISLALAEDLGEAGDLTCQALIEPEERARVDVVARRRGVLCGSPVAERVFAQLDPEVTWHTYVRDGCVVEPGVVVASALGPLRSLLSGERTALNFLTHLSGIATLTRQFVEAVVRTDAFILDTRKTHPGWRVLEKYAVRCGGGTNHRMGLYDGILIKDNHLAAWAGHGSVAEAVRAARQASPHVPVEVEVDTLEQLADALQGGPDIVLLDNMNSDMMREAVRLRDDRAPSVRLEASGGITLGNVAEIARTGVDRISIGALTHSAPALDLAFDWPSAATSIDSGY